jgi:hypothetical protein
MALVGGGGVGGAGNPVGGTFGGSTSFQTVGDHIYGYNGGVDTGSQSAETTVFESDTGSYYTVGTVHFSINSTSGDDIMLAVYFNDQPIHKETASSGSAEHDMWPLNIIIPPYTKVKLTATNLASGTGREIFTNISGRMY